MRKVRYVNANKSRKTLSTSANGAREDARSSPTRRGQFRSATTIIAAYLERAESFEYGAEPKKIASVGRADIYPCWKCQRQMSAVINDPRGQTRRVTSRGAIPSANFLAAHVVSFLCSLFRRHANFPRRVFDEFHSTLYPRAVT